MSALLEIVQVAGALLIIILVCVVWTKATTEKSQDDAHAEPHGDVPFWSER